MGVVYLALCEKRGDLVALKTIIPQVSVSQKDIQRFLREADILRQLSHPHIVAFREVGESSGRIYFAMDYVPGKDAARLVRENGGLLPIPRAVLLVCQMLEALQHAHDRKFVHRDIKPNNLLVKSADGRDFALLTDFGLGRVYQASRMSGLTMTGEFAGTLEFMAPEQITNFREAKPHTDQYAAGAAFYFLLTGFPPYDLSGRIEQRLLTILQDNPVPIRKRRPDIPPKLANVVHRALARDPNLRFPELNAMRTALDAWHR
jgi:serine/threonine-protein kinase